MFEISIVIIVNRLFWLYLFEAIQDRRSKILFSITATKQPRIIRPKIQIVR